MEHKKLELIPSLDACDFPQHVEEELTANDIGTHYESDGVRIDWNDDSFPILKQWLLDTYGEIVKQYDTFSIIAT